jgi:hypothetical protein
MSAAWEITLGTLRKRWHTAVILDTTAELADQLRAKLASVPRNGGHRPMYAAAAVALLVEVGELQADGHNGICMCWLDLKHRDADGRGRRGRAALATDVDRDGDAARVQA